MITDKDLKTLAEAVKILEKIQGMGAGEKASPKLSKKQKLKQEAQRYFD